MIVMEKWIPKKPISAIYFDGEKERYYVKRFVVENEGQGRKLYFRSPKFTIGNCFYRLETNG